MLDKNEEPMQINFITTCPVLSSSPLKILSPRWRCAQLVPTTTTTATDKLQSVVRTGWVAVTLAAR